MIKGKKLAQSFRKEDRLIVRKEKNCFWITDTYILIKLSIKEGKKFLMKWNSYKTTKDLPHLEKGKAYEIKPRIEGFIEDCPLQKATMTIKTKQIRLRPGLLFYVFILSFK